ncbi:flagellar hook-basal body complex protein FliE [Paenibacillus uliginis N3/975]|uniref:Flagellar hook-basal body complex protein FliE n=1 Tax=Paenibacillus uliginis N3/975 TaxID=1313296 RepID=A0A1X7H871_9BACL|nr:MULTISPECIES: flagellar hook-basal body complex protein FliE [Paenibacillus]UNK16713.1 flagellar hook-basal body complex protein FliE [Paenibacillus sp. N3/727]SMF81519.1 flagellar hook-basal body complex protein FliE [Paenibacillus uliginis N3/975]
MIQNTMFSTGSIQPLQVQSTPKVEVEATPSKSIGQFGSYLEDALQSVAALEEKSHVMTDKLMLGQVNVDQAMISAQQALLSVQLTTQVRNKVVEAYQEIMRTQI